MQIKKGVGILIFLLIIFENIISLADYETISANDIVENLLRIGKKNMILKKLL